MKSEEPPAGRDETVCSLEDDEVYVISLNGPLLCYCNWLTLGRQRIEWGWDDINTAPAHRQCATVLLRATTAQRQRCTVPDARCSAFVNGSLFFKIACQT